MPPSSHPLPHSLRSHSGVVSQAIHSVCTSWVGVLGTGPPDCRSRALERFRAPYTLRLTFRGFGLRNGRDKKDDLRMEVERRTDGGDADTWAGVASRALEAVCESWWKLVRVCVFLVFVALALTAGGWLWVR